MQVEGKYISNAKRGDTLLSIVVSPSITMMDNLITVDNVDITNIHFILKS